MREGGREFFIAIKVEREREREREGHVKDVFGWFFNRGEN